MHLAVWTLRLFYVLIAAIGVLVMMLPSANGLGLTVGLILFMIAGLVEFVIIQGLLRLEKWAWWLALLVCVLLICSLWFTIFGLFGLWGLLAAQPRFDAHRRRAFNPRDTWRPAGVNIIATAQFLLGVLSLSGVTFLNPPTSRPFAQGGSSEFLLVWSFLLAIGILSLCMGCGVCFLQRWAWYGTLIPQGLSVFGFIYFVSTGEISLLLHLCFSLVAFGYLLDPNVKYALRH
jgi:MFS family permease